MTTKDTAIHLAKEGVTLEGLLTVPKGAKGLVVFAHGSGSGRFSPRNQFVAGVLNQENMGTLLLDLLTPEEEMIDEQTRQYRFDIALLARRLVEVRQWLGRLPEAKSLKIAYFGSSTGAAAALIAAAAEGNKICAVVSRGGRPDLAAPLLAKVQAAALFLVGGNDFGVIELNQEAFDQLQCTKKMIIVPGATHLFEEPGTLEEVAQHAAKWFKQYCTEES